MNLVQYKNDLNRVAFNFNEKGLDIFFAICQQAKNKGTDEVTMTYDDIARLSNYKSRSLERFNNDLDLLYSQLLSLSLKTEDKNKIIRFTLFTKYIVDKSEKKVTISVNKDFQYLLNDFLSGNYTKFDLAEFTSIKSIYAKNMFRLLKQYQYSNTNTKFLSFQMNEFKEILNIPPKYKMCEIDVNILKKLKDQLKHHFPNFNYTKVKEGRNIIGIKFQWEDGIVEKKEINSQLKEKMENCLKNIYISKLFNYDKLEDLIIELLNSYKDYELEFSLIETYKKIKKEFKHKNYLRKTIENIIKENSDEIIKYKDKRKVFLTEEEYKIMYEKYLKENNFEDNLYIKHVFNMKYGIKN